MANLDKLGIGIEAGITVAPGSEAAAKSVTNLIVQSYEKMGEARRKATSKSATFDANEALKSRTHILRVERMTQAEQSATRAKFVGERARQIEAALKAEETRKKKYDEATTAAQERAAEKSREIYDKQEAARNAARIKAKREDSIAAFKAQEKDWNDKEKGMRAEQKRLVKHAYFVQDMTEKELTGRRQAQIRYRNWVQTETEKEMSGRRALLYRAGQRTTMAATREMAAGLDYSKIRFGADQLQRVIDPMTSTLKRGAQEGLKFEEAMGHVQKSISPQEFKKYEKGLRDTARQMAMRFTEDPEQMARGLGVLLRAGVMPGTQGFGGILESSVAVSKVEGRSLESVVETLLQMTYVLTNDSTKLPMIADKLTAASLASTVSLGDLRKAMTYGAGAMQAFGIPLDQQIAMMALFGDQLVKGSLGGTTMTRMLQQMASQTWKTTDAFKVMAKFSGSEEIKLSSFSDAAGNLTKFPELISAIGAQYRKLDPEGKHGLIYKLFGVRGGLGFQAFDQLLKTAPDRYSSYLKSVQTADGVAVRQALAQSNNIGGAVKRVGIGLKNVATSIFETIGAVAAPTIDRLGISIGSVARAYTLMFRDNKTRESVAQLVGPGATAWANSLKNAMDGLGSTFRTVTAPIRAVTSMLGWLSKNGGSVGEGVSFIGSKLLSTIGALIPLGIGLGAIGLAGKGFANTLGFGAGKLSPLERAQFAAAHGPGALSSFDASIAAAAWSSRGAPSSRGGRFMSSGFGFGAAGTSGGFGATALRVLSKASVWGLAADLIAQGVTYIVGKSKGAADKFQEAAIDFNAVARMALNQSTQWFSPVAGPQGRDYLQPDNTVARAYSYDKRTKSVVSSAATDGGKAVLRGAISTEVARAQEGLIQKALGVTPTTEELSQGILPFTGIQGASAIYKDLAKAGKVRESVWTEAINKSPSEAEKVFKTQGVGGLMGMSGFMAEEMIKMRQAGTPYDKLSEAAVNVTKQDFFKGQQLSEVMERLLKLLADLISGKLKVEANIKGNVNMDGKNVGRVINDAYADVNARSGAANTRWQTKGAKLGK